MCGRSCKQLGLLLWKNWVLKKRRWSSTLLEILIPLAAIFILMLIRLAVSVDDVALQFPIDNPQTISAGQLYLLGQLACGSPSNLKFDDTFPQARIALTHNLGPDSVEANHTATLLRLRSFMVQNLHKAAELAKMDQIFCPRGLSVQTINVSNYIDNIVMIFPNEALLESYIQQDNYGLDESIGTVRLGVVFNSLGPSSYKYTMRANSTDVPWTGLSVNNLLVGFDYFQFYTYYTSHLLNVQYMVDNFILVEKASRKLIGDIGFVSFPIRAHKQDNFQQYVSNIIGLFLVAAFMWPFSRMVRNQVEEKEKRIKEGLAQMGLTNSLFWFSWAITYLVEYLVLVILVVIFVKINLFPYASTGILFFYFFSFILSLLSLGCLLSTFFSRAKTAGTISPFFLLCMYLPYFSVSDSTKDESAKNAACLLSPVAFSLGAGNLLSFESAFIGSQSDNIGELVDNFRLSTAISLMLFDAFLYALIAWYTDLIWPTEYGTHLPWYFPVSPKFWASCCCPPKSKGRKQNDGIVNNKLNINSNGSVQTTGSSPNKLKIPLLDRSEFSNNPRDEIEIDHSDIEPVPDSMRDSIGIRIENLKKKFPGAAGSQDFYAVNGLNLNMYRGQIFVLLGHNGAGKSTTLNMLMGSLEPSEGTAYIEDMDISTDLETVRKSLGVCPQHDVLFDDLTVQEHLILFAKLKEVKPELINSLVTEAIKEVQLEAATNQASSTLSGGQKRRLSLAIALIGDSRVIFLDEPTSGVDPFSRRAIWELLVKKKPGRTIILTTHYMDEADQLGDRIGIMSSGKLKCCGSSLFLKRKFGVGYCMTLTKSSEHEFDASRVTALLKNYVPSAEMLTSVGSELSYRLPFSASAQFPPLLNQLDSELKQLNLVTYGLSVTTLEEVFIKVAQESESENKDRAETMQKAGRQLGTERAQGDAIPSDLLQSNPEGATFFKHFTALIQKRFNVTKRDKKAACCQILVPLILLSLGLGLLRIPPDFDFPNLALTPDEFNQPDYVAVSQGLNPSLAQGNPKGAVYEPLTNSSSLLFFSYAILNAPSIAQSRYGALWGNPADASSDLVSYYILNNITALHGLPTWMTLAHSSLLRNATNDPTANIESNVHPFSWTHRQKSQIQSINGIFASIVISFGFSFIPASYAVFVVSERETKSKHLQLISGVSIPSYWLSNYLWDIVSFAIPCAMSVIIIVAFGNPNFVGANFPVVVTSFILYGLAVIPFTYLLSFLFTSHSTAQNVMILLYLLGGTILSMVAFALYLIPSTRDLNNTYLRFLFRLLPNFCLGDSVFYLSVREYITDHPNGQWDPFITGYDMVFLAWESVVYFLLTIMVEYLSSMPQVVAFFKKDKQVNDIPGANDDREPEDVDIIKERQRIEAFTSLNQISSSDDYDPRIENPVSAQQDIITLQGLTKTYGNKIAARNVAFSIPQGQCFGFLGVNGAGKSTTLKMLTGDELPTSGTATLGGFDIIHYPQQVRRIMGYCPQFDALHELLTGRETLQFYGRLRGIPESQLNEMVTFLIDRLTLHEYADRPSGTYSGGNKRKLSVAIALIGNPQVVFLDEPSSGMDPVSRRFMWDFISETMTDRAVILTTHSMEECEALCQRIGILVAGEMKCIGTAQHLKNRFGRGFQVDVSTGASSIIPVQEWIKSTFVNAEIVEAYGGKIKFKIPQPAENEVKPGDVIYTLRQIFSLIENVKSRIGISEYSVGQTTLEQIFIYFAKQGAEWAEHHGHEAPVQTKSGLVLPFTVPRNLPRYPGPPGPSRNTPPNSFVKESL